MLIIEAEQGKVQVGGKMLAIGDVTAGLANVFGLNQLFFQPLQGDVQTLWFNESNFVTKELVPAEVVGMVKQEFGIA